MTNRETMQLALDAFEEIPENIEGYLPDSCNDAATALRAALAQPEQEPVAWMRRLDVYYMKQDGIRAVEVESVKSEKHFVPLYTKEHTP